MTDQDRFTITSLLDGKSAVVQIVPAGGGGLPGTAGPAVQGPQGLGQGLGLAIDNVAALPDAEDYAVHEFYAANFTPAEIEYCLKQPSAKAAFQGLLAAKRAIVKAGAASEPGEEGQRSIEIVFDEQGRPSYPGCLLSTSDTGMLAAAICLWPSGLGWQPAAARGAESPPRQILSFPVKTRIFAFFVLLSLLILFALGFWKLVELGHR